MKPKIYNSKVLLIPNNIIKILFIPKQVIRLQEIQPIQIIHRANNKIKEIID